MKPVVPDTVIPGASTALAWCFPDEASEYADDVLVKLEGKTILVPAVWALEIANAILTGERKKRLKAPEIGRFADLLEALPIVEDRQTARECIAGVVPLAREHNLSAYDAAYLGLAIRRGAPLATLDARLVKAAQKSGIGIFASGRR